MRLGWMVAGVFALAVAGAAGWARSAGRFDAAADRINAAIELQPALQEARRRLDAELQAAPQDRPRIEAELRQALVERVALCAPAGYVPSRWHTLGRIRQDARNPLCYAGKDAELQQWVGLQRMRLALRLPALVPVPAEPPARVALAHHHKADFARRAAVVAVSTFDGALTVLDALGGKTLLNLPDAKTQHGFDLSANGRVLFDHAVLQKEGRPLRVRLVETGEVLATFDNVFTHAWLGQDHLLINHWDGRTTLQNLDQRHAWQVQPLEGLGVHAAYAVPDAPGRFVLMAVEQLLVVDVRRVDARFSALTIAERHRFSSANWGTFYHLLPDDRTLVVAGADLHRFDLKTQVMTTTRFTPARVAWFWPGAQAGQVVVKLGVEEAGPLAGPYAYAFGERTLARLALPEDGHTRVIWLEPFQRFGRLEDGGVTLFDPPIESPVAEDQVVTALVQASAQRRADEVRDAQARAVAQGQRPEGRLDMLVDDAPVVGVGVLRGSSDETTARENGGQPFGVVRVHVRGNGRPLSLLLSSQAPVRWLVTQDRGAQLKAVLVAAREPPILEGVSRALVRYIGHDFADEAEGASVERLRRSVLHLTGSSLQQFQWAADGTAFTVSAPVLPSAGPSADPAVDAAALARQRRRPR